MLDSKRSALELDPFQSALDPDLSEFDCADPAVGPVSRAPVAVSVEALLVVVLTAGAVRVVPV